MLAKLHIEHKFTKSHNQFITLNEVHFNTFVNLVVNLFKTHNLELNASSQVIFHCAVFFLMSSSFANFQIKQPIIKLPLDDFLKEQINEAEIMYGSDIFFKMQEMFRTSVASGICDIVDDKTLSKFLLNMFCKCRFDEYD